MKHILLISELFYPTNRIGALRPSKICKFLLERGYSVDVITAYPSSGIYNSERCTVYAIYKKSAIENNTCIAKHNMKFHGRFAYQLRYFKRALASYRMGSQYTKKAMMLFENKVLRAEDYDACFTTYGPISSVLIGLKLKKKYRIRNWVCDFRDPMTIKMRSIIMHPFYKHLQSMVCKYSDKIVAVSNGYIQRIVSPKYRSKAYMIPNGYDQSDAIQNVKVLRNSFFTFTYVGALYEGKRDITPIFRAISELNQSGEVDASKLRFAYAGSEFTNLTVQAKKYGMQSILENHGSLQRCDCLQLQYTSNVLILSTWNERGEEGVFPGKFLEYMLIGRPIIALTCGDLPNSEVTSVIREGNLGVAYESANDKKDYKDLKEFIRKAYNDFVREGNVYFAPVQNVLARYNYDEIMNRIEELL